MLQGHWEGLHLLACGVFEELPNLEKSCLIMKMKNKSNFDVLCDVIGNFMLKLELREELWVHF